MFQTTNQFFYSSKTIETMETIARFVFAEKTHAEFLSINQLPIRVSHSFNGFGCWQKIQIMAGIFMYLGK